MCDTGTCLTMHQPWASLLIKGIKIHEGRVWPTNHRGRLWIHSSSRHADQETLDDVLKDHPEGNDLDWPISSLLGFVNVDDCLNQVQLLIKSLLNPFKGRLQSAIYGWKEPGFLRLHLLRSNRTRYQTANVRKSQALETSKRHSNGCASSARTLDYIFMLLKLYHLGLIQFCLQGYCIIYIN